MSKNILCFGAGLSSTNLITYLLEKCEQNNWFFTLADLNLAAAEMKINRSSHARAEQFTIEQTEKMQELVSKADVVISLLPAAFHPVIAEECLRQRRHLFTASYVSEEMKKLDREVKANGLLFMNECGLDPGIDHMSAMKIIHEIQEKGGRVTEFESNTGGLVAPEFDNNPWNYKLTWNARNVILAGQAGAKFLQDGQYKYVPYHQLFKRTHQVQVLDYGSFDVYANRDSLSYRELYGLDEISTLIRGTMRRPGYCQAYDTFIQLGLTNDTFQIENSDKLTNRQFIEAFLPTRKGMSTEDNFCETLGLKRHSEVYSKIEWLGCFNDTPVQMKNASPAQILQSIIEPKWQLGEEDLDMIVMQHRFVYEFQQKKYQRFSSLVVTGKDKIQTAMSQTVGIPLAIAVRLFLEGKIKHSGVVIPVHKDIYMPILEELTQNKVVFIEDEHEI